MRLDFRALDLTGPRGEEEWRVWFLASWAEYKSWYLSEGPGGRPTYLACERAMRAHMPELLPVWLRRVELAGGGDLASRFLSLWCPPPIVAGCSQLAVGGAEPALLRNYDYAAQPCEATVLRTRFTTRTVLGMSDCNLGLLDGMNQDGLAVSLAFGGRRVVGPGFAITLVLRYLLETCAGTAEAVAVLGRMPVHMAYNVALIDRTGEARTVLVAPDRPAEVRPGGASTNHQRAVEWPEHARLTDTLARAEVLEALGAGAELESFLRPPLYLERWSEGWGTLYSADYRPLRGEVTYAWPGRRWVKSLSTFVEDDVSVSYGAPLEGA